jgi:DNA-binding MarR family transcriptional regulator
MKEFRKALQLDRDTYYETHLSILNCIFPSEIRMTAMEIKVLSSFMALNPLQFVYKFGPKAKTAVREKLNLSPSGLSNYFKTLIEKGYLKVVGDTIKITEIVLSEEDEQLYMFKLILQK